MFGYHARIFLAMANTDIRSSGGASVIRAECSIGLRQIHTKSHQLHREEGCSMRNGRAFSIIHEVWV